MTDPTRILRDLLDSVKKYRDVDLTNKAIEIHTVTFDLQQENLKLSKELAIAKEQLELRNKLKLKQFGDVHHYILGDEGIAYCPVCYGKNQALIPLPAAGEKVGGFGRVCHSCKNFFIEN